VALGGLEQIERLLLVLHDGLDLDRAVPVDRDLEIDQRLAEFLGALLPHAEVGVLEAQHIELEALLQLGDVLRELLARDGLPAAARHQRRAAEGARLGAAEAREVAEGARRILGRPVARQREAVAHLHLGGAHLNLGVALVFQQFPRHALELVETGHGAVRGVDHAIVAPDGEARHFGEILTRIQRAHDLSEGQLALAEAHGVGDAALEVHLRRDAGEPAAPDDGQLRELLAHGMATT